MLIHLFLYYIVKMETEIFRIYTPDFLPQLLGANLSQDMEVEIQAEDGYITIRPIRGNKLSLEDLLAKITPENQHSLIDLGSPRGKEVR
jgi:antitoxin component of MazEF toxin-antitoxin module